MKLGGGTAALLRGSDTCCLGSMGATGRGGVHCGFLMFIIIPFFRRECNSRLHTFTL